MKHALLMEFTVIVDNAKGKKPIMVIKMKPMNVKKIQKQAILNSSSREFKINCNYIILSLYRQQ
jgi:hypothetical protein